LLSGLYHVIACRRCNAPREHVHLAWRISIPTTSQEVMFKPFRPPLLKGVPRPAPVRAEVDTSDTQIISDSEEEILTRPTKKRRLLIHEVDEAPKTKVPIASAAASAPRKPLLVVPNSAEPSKATNAPPTNVAPVEKYYLVLW
jgi:DNA repair and recombination protein RAD54B